MQYPLPYSSYTRIPTPADTACAQEALLPEGICRVTDEALGKMSLLGEDAFQKDEQGRVLVAAFDFDGTCIHGNSPVMLVRYLTAKRMLDPSVVARIIAWGVAYKTRLPQNEVWVRELVFRAFDGKPVREVNRFLQNFYDQKIAQRFRPSAMEKMKEHLDLGHAVVCVSASFEPIIAAAMEHHPIQFGIATRMQIDLDQCYTNHVVGIPTEGTHKVDALERFCDEYFGTGKWVFGWAYGDHHSDAAMLAAAQEGFAVTPDRPLKRTAGSQGYEILDWK